MGYIVFIKNLSKCPYEAEDPLKQIWENKIKYITDCKLGESDANDFTISKLELDQTVIPEIIDDVIYIIKYNPEFEDETNSDLDIECTEFYDADLNIANDIDDDDDSSWVSIFALPNCKLFVVMYLAFLVGGFTAILLG